MHTFGFVSKQLALHNKKNNNFHEIFVVCAIKSNLVKSSLNSVIILKSKQRKTDANALCHLPNEISG